MSPPLPPRPLRVLADDGHRNRLRRHRHLYLLRDLAAPLGESRSRRCSAAGELRKGPGLAGDAGSASSLLGSAAEGVPRLHGCSRDPTRNTELCSRWCLDQGLS